MMVLENLIGSSIRPFAFIIYLVALIAAFNLSVTATHATAKPLRIVAFGDSLTAGYMLKAADAFPNQLQKALRAKGHQVTVLNAGVSGDTTSAGIERLDWAISEPADIVILELGANDALRGIDPDIARTNLDRMITAIKAKGARVLLAGMKAPGNWGDGYVDKFDAIFPGLAAKHAVVLYPFFLEGVALDRKLSLDDGLHPSAAGVAEIVRRIVPSVEKVIADVTANAAAPSP